jgi:integrase
LKHTCSKHRNIRRGFFERADLTRLLAHLPMSMQGIATFAFLTGWRTPSDILPLKWQQVDWSAGEVRLDAGTT